MAAPLDAALIASLYEEHGGELRRFVLGVVCDPDLAGDVLQATFVKAVERGHTAQVESLKGWLFRVAYHEALAARRRRAIGVRAGSRLADLLQRPADRQPDDPLVRTEAIEAVRQALDMLPVDQRRVVWARIYEDKSFAEIAGEQGVPLGTALTRMRLALGRLRRALRPGD